ncbi:MAG: signal peptidase II [bacterium]
MIRFAPRVHLTAVTLFLADQASKWLALSRLADSVTTPLIPSVFHLTLVHNTGAAFGMFHGGNLVLGLVAALVAGALTIWHASITQAHPGREWAVGLILGGALGNLFDRVYRSGVVDFLDFRVWPVFNVADSAICVGAGWMMLTWRARPPEGGSRRVAGPA